MLHFRSSLLVSVLSCPGIPYLSRDVTAYAGVLCDKAVMFVDMIKEYFVLCRKGERATLKECLSQNISDDT